MAYCIRHVTNMPDSILTGDVNAHSTLWYSHTDDHWRQLISNIISNSEHIILNTDTPTRVPHTTLHQATSPDITTISTTLYNRKTWHTIHAPNKNYNKTDTHSRTIGKQTGHSSLQTPRLPSLTFNHHQTYTLQTPFSQTSSSTQTNTPSQKVRYTTHANYFQNTRHKIEHRNNIRAQNASDPSISELNSEITSLIQTPKYDIWREHLDTHWDHKHNTHTLWKTIHGLVNKTPTQPKNNTMTFKEKTLTLPPPTQIANAFNKQFTNTVKHKTQKQTDTQNTLKLQTTNITLTTTQVQVAHRTTWTRIPHQHVQYITKQQYHPSYMETSKHHSNPKTKRRHERKHIIQTHLTSLSDSKTLEKTLLPYITDNISTQHSLKSNNSTSTVLHNINNTIATKRLVGEKPNGEKPGWSKAQNKQISKFQSKFI